VTQNHKEGEGIKNKLLCFLSDSRSEIAVVEQSETGNRWIVVPRGGRIGKTDGFPGDFAVTPKHRKNS